MGSVIKVVVLGGVLWLGVLILGTIALFADMGVF